MTRYRIYFEEKEKIRAVRIFDTDPLLVRIIEFFHNRNDRESVVSVPQAVSRYFQETPEFVLYTDRHEVHPLHLRIDIFDRSDMTHHIGPIDSIAELRFTIKECGNDVTLDAVVRHLFGESNHRCGCSQRIDNNTPLKRCRMCGAPLCQKCNESSSSGQCDGCFSLFSDMCAAEDEEEEATT